MNEILKDKLASFANRQERLRFWCDLARCWGIAALAGLALAVFQRDVGWSSWISLPAVVLVALLLVVFRQHSARVSRSSGRSLAREIEAKFPELDGRLLTAVQQNPAEQGRFSFLQERLLSEVLRHSAQRDWGLTVSDQRLRLAQTMHWGAVVVLCVILFQLRAPIGRGLLLANDEASVTVTPGDASVERGSALVVLARFSGPLPSSVEMLVGRPGASAHFPLVKSLADPMFGGTLPEVTSNFSYRVSYSGHTTREFHVAVFEYPKLQRADVDVSYPEYTGETNRHIPDTRRLSAVEGSRLDLQLQFNKPVVLARLVSRSKDHQAIQLMVETNRPAATLTDLPLDTTQTYDLQLLDADGRTNKVPAQFVFQALKNRAPEIRLTSPRGDTRPSALEEIPFEGTVWDDFGLIDYGLGYSIDGQPAQFLTVGEKVPGKKKEAFQHLLRLEDLHVKPDELVSWFVWADDLGPDGKPRRTVSDLFFGEVRPFDEVFREGQGNEGQGQSGGGGGGGGGQTARLTELQKQIISATWNLQRARQQSSEATPDSRRRRPESPGPESRNHHVLPGAGLFSVGVPRLLPAVPGLKVVGQVDRRDSPTEADPTPGAKRDSRANAGPKASNAGDDLGVVRDSQAQAIQQATQAAERARDGRAEGLWRSALQQMEKALAQLEASTNSPAQLAQALAAEQAAYQTLLKLQEHEYQVSRQRNRGQSGGGQQQQMQRQLDQLELTQSENRYENQRQAQAPQNSQRREQLQVMNRLQELARRQTDLNDRLKELQTALQEARTEQERAELQRRLKRLQEEEQQMLADVDELRQRMDRPENQSRMADERRQLEQTREDVQRASEAARQGSASQALASGTRAARQLQQMRDQMRKANSSEFAEDMRSMREQARELAQRQQEVQKAMQADDSTKHRSLSDATDNQALLSQLSRQRALMTNLVERASQISQQAETSEPLLSSQLYDTVRKFTQDSAKNVKELQDDLLSRGLMPNNLIDLLKNESENEGAKLLDVTSEMLRRDFDPQAAQASQRAGERIQDLKRGVEHAAESVLGDDTEALRLAQQELDQLTGQLQNEMNRAGQSAGQTNGAPSSAGSPRPNQAASGRQSNPGERASAQSPEQEQASSSQGSPSGQNGQQGQRPSGSSPGEQQGGQSDRSPQEQNASQSSDVAQNSSGNRGVRSAQGRSGSRTGSRGGGGARAGGPHGGDSGWSGGREGGGSWDLDRLLNEQPWRRSGPITGEDFGPWSDRLCEVEEMVEIPDLRNEVATARERARQLRQEYQQSRKKPDWAVVRNEVMHPLAEVRRRISDELARRDSGEALVPIDRDPVPSRYSELVRRYYEELGKDK